ncbi:MAG: hypothetical protein DSY89_03910, partial [Deltaproteobacteria bacterium]
DKQKRIVMTIGDRIFFISRPPIWVGVIPFAVSGEWDSPLPLGFAPASPCIVVFNDNRYEVVSL